MSTISRQQRRHIERAIKQLMEVDGDRCSICHAALLHNSKTYGGTIDGDVPALVGECCASKLERIVTAGLYVAQKYEAFGVGKGSRKSHPAEKITSAIDAYQKHIAAMDRLASDFAEKAGVSHPLSVCRLNSPWKTDDAKWFAKNPERAHRLRPVFRGELVTLVRGEPNETPPGHEFLVLVRQVERGVRIRHIFCHNVETPIPDVEPIIHAIFDLVKASDGVPGNVLNARAVAELATKYADADRGVRS